MKQIMIAAVISAVSLMGCSKEEQKTQGNPAESVTSFREMNVPEGFDFSGTKTITLTSTGNGANGRDLLIVQTVDGITLLKHNRDVAQDFKMHVNVPADTKELVVLNGLIKQYVKINSSVIDLNSI